ncbi:dephospho-CoA kinase [Vibrio gallicus]|uniref:dephospho-CoA kinase n=1 Tax=Vibrio gallicus TaxID=190897 RepID=UPI0021C26072|nr:dephospho-CoA kinase [Vibrio gallicus]
MSLVIGLTGGIGSGKTTVANLFHDQYRIEVVDADIIAREVVQAGTEALQAIANRFGQHILNPDDSLNRRCLRAVIFNDPQQKQWLDALLHPLIREQMLRQIHDVKSPYCLLVIPLMVENELQHLAQRVLVVDVSEKTQIDRTMTRDQVSQHQVESILKSQASRAQRLAIADDVITNNDHRHLAEQVERLHLQYLAMTEVNNGE